jgi:hypothetical protein
MGLVSEASSESAHGAGWRSDGRAGGWADLLDQRVRPRWTEFSWLAVRSLLDSANDTLAKNIHDLVNARRMRWMAAQRAAGADAELRISFIEPDTSSLSFLLVGDPGEADASQYVLVGNPSQASTTQSLYAGPLQAKAHGTDFILMASDVIYPAGDVNDYENAFFLPYWWYPGPILGQPGNHDWYDGLAGFMWQFCGAEPLAPLEYRAGSFTAVERIARRLWRKASRPNRSRLLAWRAKLASQDGERWVPPQPGPYFSVETRDIKVLVIDNGITGAIDREQGEWLLRESAGSKAKLLITGKPIYVNNRYHPGRIIWDDEESDLLLPPAQATVDDIVRDPDRNFVAAIGGDTHSYQRYSVRVRPGCRGGDLASERTIEYIVAGGGGAYLSATHTFGRVNMAYGITKDLPPEVQPVGEENFHCYPLRGDSVAYYVEPLGRFLRKYSGRSLLALLIVGATFATLLADARRIHGLSIGGAILTVGATLVAVLLLPAIAVGAGKLAPRGYGFFCSACAAAAVLLAGLWGLDRADWWDHAWVMVPATLAALGVPLGAVLAGYYTRGSSPRYVPELVTLLVLGAAVMALVGWQPWRTAEGRLGAAAVAFVALLVLVPVAGAVRRDPAKGRTYRRIMILAGLTLAVLGAWQGWGYWPVRAGLVAAGSLVLLLVLAFAGLLFGSGAWWPLLCRDFRDPTERADRILTLVHKRLGLADLPRNVDVDSIDGRTRRLVDVLAPVGGNRLLDGLISQAADRNQAPFFKQFLRLAVRKGVLRIECWGVTGWAQDTDAPPLEDSVEILL